MESMVGQGLGKAAALLAEARDLGLGDFQAIPTSWEQAVTMLRQLAESPAELQVHSVEIGDTGGEFDRLMAERDHLQDDLRRAQDELAAAKVLMANERGYSLELDEQAARLKSVGVFAGAPGHSKCPLCDAPLEQRVPAVAELEAAVEEASSELDRVSRYSPQLQAVADDLEERVAGLKTRLSENRLRTVQDGGHRRFPPGRT